MDREILAIVDGENFYGSISSNDTKEDIVNKIKLLWTFDNISRDGNSKKKYDIKKVIEELNKAYEDVVNRKLIKYNFEIELIKKNLITKDELLNEESNKYNELFNKDFEEKFFESISRDEINSFKEDKKLKEIIFNYYRFDNLEDANKCYDILNSKEYAKFLYDFRDYYNQKEETLLDLFNNRIENNKYSEKESEILNGYSHGMSFSNSGMSFSSSERGGRGNIYVDKDYNIFPDDRQISDEVILFSKLSKDMENREITKPQKYNELGDNYYIFLLKDKRELDDKKVSDIYRLFRYESKREEILKNKDIQYIYPEIVLEDDFFHSEIKLLEVNGEDIYLDSSYLNHYRYSKNYGKEELLNSINMDIIFQLRYQDIVKRVFGDKKILLEDLTDLEREELYKYEKSVMAELSNIGDDELDEYIKLNRDKLIEYEYYVFHYQVDNIDEVYNRLLKDNGAEIIADAFINKYRGSEELSDKEEEILGRFYINKEFSNGYFKESVDGVSFDYDNKLFNKSYSKYQHSFHRELKLGYYNKLKKMKLKELSKPIVFNKEFINIYESILLYNIKDSEEEIRESARRYMENEKEDNYYKTLFENADIKYFIDKE